MILLNGIGVAIMIACHYIVWVNTKTWSEFLFYVFFMNTFGALIGIPSGLFTGRSILWLRKRKFRKPKKE